MEPLKLLTRHLTHARQLRSSCRTEFLNSHRQNRSARTSFSTHLHHYLPQSLQRSHAPASSLRLGRSCYHPPQCLYRHRHRYHLHQRRPYTTNPPPGPGPGPGPGHSGTPPQHQSLSTRLRALSREYGRSALGVYLLLSLIDFPFCYLAVRMLGTERIGNWERRVVDAFSGVVGLVRGRRPAAEMEGMGEGVAAGMGDGASDTEQKRGSDESGAEKEGERSEAANVEGAGGGNGAEVASTLTPLLFQPYHITSPPSLPSSSVTLPKQPKSPYLHPNFIYFNPNSL